MQSDDNDVSRGNQYTEGRGRPTYYIYRLSPSASNAMYPWTALPQRSAAAVDQQTSQHFISQQLSASTE
jgi:hypothetical protein